MSEEKIDAILDAAYHHFGTKGFYETKISEIAEDAGVAKGTVYLYFSSKEKLFNAVTERDFSRFFETLKLKLEDLESFELKLERLTLHYLEYFYECKEYTKIFFQAPNNDPELWNTLQRNLQIYFQLVTDIMREQNLADPILKAKAFTGMLEGFKMDILHSPDNTRNELSDRTHFIVNLFIYGCNA